MACDLSALVPGWTADRISTALVGREVPTLGLPLHVGIVVHNVGTVAAVARAVLRGKALTHRVITVTGAGIREPKNLLVPIGTNYRELLEYCGGLTEDAARVIAGKKAVRKLLEQQTFVNLKNKRFVVEAGQGHVWVDTSLDPGSDAADPGSEPPLPSARGYVAGPRSVVVLVGR